MINQGHEQRQTIDTKHLALMRDHRLVYAPEASVTRSRLRILRVLLGSLLIVALVIILTITNRQRSDVPADLQLAAGAKEPSTVPAQLVITIPEPSSEWMKAFEAVTNATPSAEGTSVSAMKQLLSRKSERKKITTEHNSLIQEHNTKGIAAVKAGKFTEASHQFYQAFLIDPTNSEISENLGFSLYRDGNFNVARLALLQSLAASPERATAWGNIGGVFARMGDEQKAATAFGLNLRYSKTPDRTRSTLINLYQNDSSEHIRRAVGAALAMHFELKVDPLLRDHLGALSQFPFSALLPGKIRYINKDGDSSNVFVVNNINFPVFSNATEYSIWLASENNCHIAACIVGRISGGKNWTPPDHNRALLKIHGNASGVLEEATHQRMARLVIEHAGSVHNISLGDNANTISLAKSALSLGPIPLSIFSSHSISPVSHIKIKTQNILPLSSTPEPSGILADVLKTSPRGISLNPEQVYAKASNSVVVVNVPNAQGSGVVVAPEIVLTNCHVTKNGNISVNYQQERWPALLIASDRKLDFCILRVPGLPAAAAPMGPIVEVAPGQRVYSLGSPRGLDLTFAEGIVSALRNKNGFPLPIIQTTAPISPGSSGGGLFDEYGRLIGITTFFGAESQNLNFAMPVEFFRYVTPISPSVAQSPSVEETKRPDPHKDESQVTDLFVKPAPSSSCNINYEIELQTFGEHVSVELRIGRVGASRVAGIQKSQGGRVVFRELCPGSYFVAIGNDEYVSVTPLRQFKMDFSYNSRISLRRGTGNISQLNRGNL